MFINLFKEINCIEPLPGYANDFKKIRCLNEEDRGEIIKTKNNLIGIFISFREEKKIVLFLSEQFGKLRFFTAQSNLIIH